MNLAHEYQIVECFVRWNDDIFVWNVFAYSAIAEIFDGEH